MMTTTTKKKKKKKKKKRNVARSFPAGGGLTSTRASRRGIPCLDQCASHAEWNYLVSGCFCTAARGTLHFFVFLLFPEVLSRVVFLLSPKNDSCYQCTPHRPQLSETAMDV